MLGLGLVACGDDDDSGSSGTAGDTETTATPDADGTAGDVKGGRACAKVDQPAPKPDGGASGGAGVPLQPVVIERALVREG